MVHSLNFRGELGGPGATLDFTDPAIQFGAAGLFETLRVEAGRVHCFEAHRERLARGMAFLNIRFLFPPDRLLDLMAREVARFPLETALRLRLTVGADPSAPEVTDSQPARAFAEARPLEPALHPPIPDRPPISVATFTDYTIASTDPWRQFKSTHYYPQYEARRRARLRGFDEALLMNEHEELVEGSAHNLFWTKGMRLFSPPQGSGALPGTFAAYVRDRARSQGWETIDAPGRPEAVRAADCLFLTNALGEIRRVTRWDDLERVDLGSTPNGAALLNFIESERAARADLDLASRLWLEKKNPMPVIRP